MRLLSLNDRSQCWELPLNRVDELRAFEKLLLDRCTKEPIGVPLSLRFLASLLAPGRLAFSRCDQASPFSAAELSTLSRVSSSVSCVNVSNSGLTTLTRKPFWCLANM